MSLRDQRGMTLVEVLVATAIVSLGLALMTGTFSTAVIGARIARNSSVIQAITVYEHGKVRAAPYNPSATPYSDCFAIDNPSGPVPSPISVPYGSACAGAAVIYRADVQTAAGPIANVQSWTVTVKNWPNPTPLASPLSIYRDNR